MRVYSLCIQYTVHVKKEKKQKKQKSCIQTKTRYIDNTFCQDKKKEKNTVNTVNTKMKKCKKARNILYREIRRSVQLFFSGFCDKKKALKVSFFVHSHSLDVLHLFLDILLCRGLCFIQLTGFKRLGLISWL
jgi:hypothetical protein